MDPLTKQTIEHGQLLLHGLKGEAISLKYILLITFGTKSIFGIIEVKNIKMAKDGSWKNQEKSKLLMELLSAGHGALSWRRAWQGQTKTWPSQSLAGQDQAAEAGRPSDLLDR
ncbi:unnamed protein product [Lupinus luteus]|uniref:Uncharacterized protein n=1 Tax=Lupinus luteus TaxID=3873 RepID=A0AAV1W5W5_LUPLU